MNIPESKVKLWNLYYHLNALKSQRFPDETLHLCHYVFIFLKVRLIFFPCVIDTNNYLSEKDCFVVKSVAQESVNLHFYSALL